MSGLLGLATNDLIRRERPWLVVACALLFRELLGTAERSPLKKVLLSSRGGAWGEESAPGSGYPVLRSTNMRGSYVDVTGAAWRDVSPIHVERCSLETGDILVTKSSGSSDLVGKAALFVHPGDAEIYLFSNFTLRLRPNSNVVVPEFLAWFLRSPQALMWRYEAQHTAVGLRNLKTKDFLAQSVPVPSAHVQKAVVHYLNALEQGHVWAEQAQLPSPLDEQRRIVARIGELAALIEDAQELRARASRQTQQLVLAALGEVFRKAETEGWAMPSLDDLLILCHAGTWGEGEGSPETGYPVLRSSNIREWKLDLTRDLAHRIVAPADIDKYALAAGDILVTKSSGSPHLIGEAAVFASPPGPGPWLFSNFTQRLRPNQRLVLPKYLWNYLRSPQARAVVDEMHRTTSGLRNLKMASYRVQPVPLPALDKQRALVGYLDGLEADVDVMCALQGDTDVELQQLLPSILDRAFKGEL